MTRCPQCNAIVVAEARFCSACGGWVVHAQVAQPATGTSQGGAGQARVGASTQVKTAPRAGGGAPPQVPQVRVGPQTQVAQIRERESAPGEGRAPTPKFVGVPVGAGVAPPWAALAETVPASRDDSTVVDSPPGGAFPVAAGASVTTPTGSSAIASTIVALGSEGTGVPVVPEASLFLGRPSTVLDEAPPSLTSRSVGRTPRPLGAFLVSYQYEPLGTFWPLAIGANLVGRAGSRPDLDVGIGDATVSTEQAVVYVMQRGAGCLEIEDRGSTNGTHVNGTPVPPGRRARARHGDRVCFGSFETTVVVVP